MNKPKPHSAESEIIVIGSCLLSPDGSVYDNVSQIITSKDFFCQKNQMYFDVIGKLISEGIEIDEITVTEAIRKSGDEDYMGGWAALSAITSRVETTTMAKFSAKEVKEKSKLRQIIRAAREAEEKAYEMSDPSEIIGAALEDNIQKISDVETGTSGSIAPAAQELREDVKRMIAGTYEVQAMPTGIGQIDALLASGGIGNGEVMVLSAPTSCGKTQFALNIVLSASVSNDTPGLYFSFEMPAKQLAKRMVQTVSATNLEQARDGVMNTADQKKVSDAITKIEGSPIFTEHYVRNIAELRAKARTHKRKNKIEWLVIDYLQLVPWDSKMKKNDAIAEVSHQIKLMAMELNIPVILLAQVNREGAKRETGLTLYDLKDSGDIENDADIILLMWPDGTDVDDAKKIDELGRPYTSLKYNIAKQREGERDQKGTLQFRNNIGRFQ